MSRAAAAEPVLHVEALAYRREGEGAGFALFVEALRLERGAVAGIAGPSGATPGKPVGTVWIGWKRRGGYARSELFHFKGDRESVRRQTVAAALEGVRRILAS